MRSAASRRRALVLVLAFGAALFGRPPAALGGEPLKTDVQLWAPLILRADVSPRWALQVETMLKLTGDLRDVQNSLLRPAVVFTPNAHVALTLGYAWVPYFSPARADEHRLWQQAVFTTHARGWTLHPRVRLELRRMPVSGRSSVRLRGQFKALHALTARVGWQASISEELLLNLNDAGPSAAQGFSANRLQVGLVRQVTPRLSVETAYLLQYAHRPSPLVSEFDHAAVLTAIVELR